MSNEETFEICNYYDALPKQFRSKNHGMNEDLEGFVSVYEPDAPPSVDSIKKMDGL